MFTPKLVLTTALIITAALAAPPPPDTARQLSTLPIHFEPNIGQFHPQVRFIARNAKYQAWITDTELVLAFPTNLQPPSKNPLERPEPRPLQREIVRLKFGSQKPSAATGIDKLSGVSNYFLGKDPAKWRSNVPNFAKVRLEEVYPGIDAVFYAKGREIEYDFIVKPGADPARISMRIDGPQSPRMSSRGDLSIALANGRFTHRAPIAFQGDKPLIADARFTNGRLGFALGAYDHSLPVTMDPVLEYTTYLGGAANSEYLWQSIAVDSANNAILGGHTLSSDFPTTPGSFDTIFNNEDGFIAKLNATGTGLIFSTFLGGSAYDRLQAIAVDSIGQIYVTGYCISGDFPTTPGAYDSSPGGIDGFVTKLAANGASLIYSAMIGGTASEDPRAIAVDGSGNAYITGVVGAGYPTTPGAYDTSADSTEDVFVTKINNTGTALVYSTYLGGSGFDFGGGIAVNAGGVAYVSGLTQSVNFPTTPGALDQTHNGATDAFLAAINPTGTGLTFSTFIGGSFDDYAYGVALDAAGNPTLAGTTRSTNFPTTPGAYDTTQNGNEDAFVVKINPSGNTLVYSTFVGGPSNEGSYHLAFDSTGAIILGGYTYTPIAGFPTTAGAIDPTPNGGFDAFLAKLSPSGSSLVYSSYFGGSSDEYGISVAVDAAGNAYLAGYTLSPNLPIIAGAFDSTYGGVGYDAYIAKVSFGVTDTTPPVITVSTSVAPNANGWNNTPVTVTWTVTDAESAISSQTGCGTVTLSAETAGTTLTCTAASAGGSSSQSITVRIDMTIPGFGNTITPSPNANGWNNTNVDVNFTCSDALSGPVTATATVTVTTEGFNQSAVYVCQDRAGNVRPPITISNISIDKTPPTFSVAKAPAPNANGWNNTNVTATFTCVDGLSGPASATSAMTISTEGLNQSANSICQDLAGNTTVAAATGISIDKTMPGFGTAKSPAPNANGWNNTDVIATITCSDALSGPVNPGAAITVSTEGFNQTVSHTCQDRAGNALPIGIGNINIDKTAPAVTAVTPSPNPAAVGTPITLSASLTDAGPSGLAQADYKIDAAAYALLATASGASATVSNGIGSFATPSIPEVCVQATDLAGNTSIPECRLIAVYDPNGGFVTGGGTIQSPAGALTAQPAASGRANFAFESRYLPGANVPSGKTLFKFKTANFEFESTVYEWLVVAGARAQYKGEGVIKGVSGTYQFILTAIDGQQPGGGGQDKLRLKVTGPSGVVYDNQLGGADNDDPTTAIDGGSIVIHKP